MQPQKMLFAETVGPFVKRVFEVLWLMLLLLNDF